MKKILMIALGVLSFGVLNASDATTDEKALLVPHLQLGEQSARVCINIGCYLPSAMHVASKEGCKVVGLGPELKQMAASMTGGGKAIVTTPASYSVVFTDGSKSDTEVQHHISKVLAKITKVDDSAMIQKHLGELSEVCRATFVVKGKKLELLTNEKELQVGQMIWRKNPTNVEQIVFHSEEEYLVELRNAGFDVEEVKRPYFGELRWRYFQKGLQAGEKGLGAAYAENNPFTIFYVTKRG